MAKRRDEAIWFEDIPAWRSWLEEHHDTATECWVGCRKKGVETGITVSEALDEALCFGWIDSVRHGVDEAGFAQRYTPRTSRSPWSEVNRRRMEELLAAGRVHPSGLRAWAQRDSVQAAPAVAARQADLGPEMQQRFEADEAGWAWFQTQPPGYRRQVTWWVMEARRPETRERRFERLLADSRSNRRVDGVG